jgi:hypothetical protein
MEKETDVEKCDYGQPDAEEQYQDRSFSTGCSGLFIVPDLFTSTG